MTTASTVDSAACRAIIDVAVNAGPRTGKSVCAQRPVGSPTGRRSTSRQTIRTCPLSRTTLHSPWKSNTHPAACEPSWQIVYDVAVSVRADRRGAARDSLVRSPRPRREGFAEPGHLLPGVRIGQRRRAR